MKKILPFLSVGAIVGCNAILLLKLNADALIVVIINLVIAFILSAVLLIKDEEEKK